MSVTFQVLEGTDQTPAAVATSIFNILKDNELCATATSRNGAPYIHTAYFAFTDDLRLYLLSDPNATHSLNIKTDDRVAVAIYDSHQPWDQPKRGLQLFGTAKMTRGAAAMRAQLNYIARFAAFGTWLKVISAAERKAFSSKLYCVTVERLKLFDEPTFGEETFLTIAVQRK